jgi:Tfp pilus assembly protein PilF
LRAAGFPIEDIHLPIHHFGLLQKDPDKARHYLALARRKTLDLPHNPAAWSELADCAITNDELNESLAAIERALILDPSNPGMRLTAGWLLKEMGKTAQADLQLAAVAGNQRVTDEELAEASHLRAQIALIRENRQAAASLLRVALRLSPGNGHYLNSLGVLYLQEGRGEQARQALEKAREAMPHRAEPWLNLGLMYEAAGQTDLAASHLRQTLELDPSCPVAAAALTRLGLLK